MYAQPTEQTKPTLTSYDYVMTYQDIILRFYICRMILKVDKHAVSLILPNVRCRITRYLRRKDKIPHIKVYICIILIQAFLSKF